MRFPANKAKVEDLVMKVENCLRQVAEESIGNVNGVQFLPKKEQEALVRRAIADPAIKLRVELHCGGWFEDVAARVTQLAEDAVGTRLQRSSKIYSEKGEA